MSKSYETVNYLIRPKKQIERKLIIEIFQTLNAVLPMKEYCYFGFGSIYFADYILFHKYLHIPKMISVDKNKSDEARFLFNKPYGFIDFKLAECTTYLQRDLNWTEKLLLWLDYDSSLDMVMLQSVEFIASKAKSADAFLVTINAESCGDPADFMSVFRDYISQKLNKVEVKTDYINVLHDILITAVQNGLKNQSGIKFFPLFNIEYRDTTKMYTFGGIFCDSALYEVVNKTLSDISFISKDPSITRIDCPILTFKEKTHIDSYIKHNADLDTDAIKILSFISEEKLKEYCKYYKYYPQFFESIY